MTWKEYAQLATDLYNNLRLRGYSEEDIWRLINLYFTSGAYRENSRKPRGSKPCQ